MHVVEKGSIKKGRKRRAKEVVTGLVQQGKAHP